MIERESQENVTIVRLQHGKANALDLELLGELRDTLRDLGAGTSPVVLTGTRSMFSAGVDLLRLLREDREYIAAFLPALDHALEALFLCPRPVVAAVNGHAIAGGCILAAACDYRIGASDRGQHGVPELLVGVPFPPWPLEIMASVVPVEFRAEVFYGGGTYRGEEARRRGLLDEIVEADAVLPTAMEKAQQLGNRDATAFALTKQQLRAPAERRAREGSSAADAILAAWEAPETRETIRGYLQRTIGKSE